MLHSKSTGGGQGVTAAHHALQMLPLQRRLPAVRQRHSVWQCLAAPAASQRCCSGAATSHGCLSIPAAPRVGCRRHRGLHVRAHSLQLVQRQLEQQCRKGIAVQSTAVSQSQCMPF